MPIFYLVGPSGGTGGNVTTDYQYDTGFDRVQTVNVSAGDWIDSIQFTIVLNALSQPQTHHGGGGGNPQEPIVLADSEYISAIDGTYGDYVNSINFYVAGGGGREYDFGTPAGVQFSYPCPEGWQIYGLNCRSGDYVDAIGVILTTLP